MNRWLIAVVIGLTVAGCAEGIDDPQPAPEPDPVQKAPPVRTFSGDLNPITDNDRLGVSDGVINTPAHPNMPSVPMPGQE